VLVFKAAYFVSVSGNVRTVVLAHFVHKALLREGRGRFPFGAFVLTPSQRRMNAKNVRSKRRTLRLNRFLHKCGAALIVKATVMTCAGFAASASAIADDTGTAAQSAGFSLIALPSNPPMVDAIVDDSIRILANQGVEISRAEPGISSETNDDSLPNTLILAGLDSIVERWEETADSSANLLGDLKPVTEVVRDHQAFLMLQTERQEQLRTVFSRAHGAAGPMTIGGLSAYGQRDHLVAMMLMDAAGQEPVEYPYRQYNSLNDLAIALLTGEIKLASIPVSQALEMPLEGGIRMVATTTNQRQDVTKGVPTLLSARIELQYTNFIGLYSVNSTKESGQPELPESLGTLTHSSDWSEEIYDLGLVDDYTNEGNFTVNVLRELTRLKRFSEMLQ